jgi:hypothetical protein
MCDVAWGDGKKRQLGNEDLLPSGFIRVRVYAPAGPDQEREVERVKAEFIAQVRAQRHPRADATVQQPIEPSAELCTGDSRSRRRAGLPRMHHPGR